MAEEEIEKIVFPKKRKRLWFCGMCGKRCDSFIDLENHVDECEKGMKNQWDAMIYRADNIASMQIY